MGGDSEITDLDNLRASLRRLHRLAEWYRARLQEVSDKITLLENVGADKPPDGETSEKIDSHSN